MTGNHFPPPVPDNPLRNAGLQLPPLSDLVSLVRAPAALSVPGDILAGATAAGRPLGPRTAGAMASSVCLYWAGMALNDYADAAVDSVERPARPVPSGRVPRRTALAVATGLTGAGLGLAAVSGGRRGLAVALPLTALIWAYDLKLKSTPAGPAAMAGARALDVLAGAVAGGGSPPWHGPRGEWHGRCARSRRRPRPPHRGAHLHDHRPQPPRDLRRSGTAARHDTRRVVGHGTVDGAAFRTSRRSPAPARTAPGGGRPNRRRLAGVLAYLGTYGWAQARAVRDPQREFRTACGGSGHPRHGPPAGGAHRTRRSARRRRTPGCSAPGGAALARRVSPT